MDMKVKNKRDKDNGVRLWSQLPFDIVEKIGQEFISQQHFVDYERFRAVCKSWRSATLDFLHLNSPWLLLPFDEESDKRSFYIVADGKVITLSLPQTRGCRIIGSTQGFLVLINSQLYISLFNPLTRAHVPMIGAMDDSNPPPPLLDIDTGDFDSNCQLTERNLHYMTLNLRNYRLSKLIFYQKGGIFMATMTSQMRTACFTTVGMEEWVLSLTPSEMYFDDIINFNCNFYAVDYKGNIYMCEFDIKQRAVSYTIVAETPLPHEVELIGHKLCSVVESSGELLLLIRYRTSMEYVLNNFRIKVYKLKFNSSYKAKCISVNNLGDQALFLGENHPGENQVLSYSATKFPGSLRRNCVYFTTFYFAHYVYGPGVYNLEDDSIEAFPFIDITNDDRCPWQRPLWLTPTLVSSIQNSVSP